MKTIRKLNIFLLIVAIICTVTFAIIDSNEEKYGKYENKITVTFNDIESGSYGETTVSFTVKNNGNADVGKVKFEMQITNASNSNESYTSEVSCNFNYENLKNLETKDFECSLSSISSNKWLVGKKKSELKFAYRITSVTFKNNKTYECNNSQFVGGSQSGGSQNGGSQSGGSQNGGSQNGGSQNSGSQHTHDYKTLKYNSNNHWYECSCGKKQTAETHKGGTATCTSKAVCTVCNQEYGNYASHTYSSDWVITDTHHYQESTCGCNVKKDYGTHTADSSGFCSLCDLPMRATEGLIIDKSSDGTYAEVIGYSGTATKINIPKTYNNLPVKTIYKEAFKNTNITTVVIGDSVTSIGSSAFRGCYSLESVVIGNSVTSIGEGAFYNCYSLTSVTIGDSVTSIGDDAFYWCTSLESIEIPNSVTSIGDWAFYDCYSLKSVTIGDSVTSIGDYAFYDCDSLESVVIPNSVTSIGDWAFYDCSKLYVEKDNIRYIKANDNDYYLALEVLNKNLSTYTIQNTTKILGYGLFSNCERLSTITIPNSVTSICNDAFEDCYSLASIKYRGTQSQWNAISKGTYWNYNTGNYTIAYNYTGN